MYHFDFREKFLQGANLKVSQNYKEFTQFLNWVNDHVATTCPNGEPYKYIEVGSYAGESLYYVGKLLPKGSLMTIIDLGDNLVANSILENKTIPYLRSLGLEIHYVKGDGRSKESIRAAFEKAPYNLCFIDANHNFEFAFPDFLNYGRLAHWISFHDISKFNTYKTILKHKVFQANANHLWECIKVLWPRKLPTGEQTMFEFVDHDNDPHYFKKNAEGEKPRGFGIVYNFFNEVTP